MKEYIRTFHIPYKMTSITAGGGYLYISDLGYATSPEGSWTSIASWPVTITNSNTSAPLIVEFTTDLTFNNSNQYFICGSVNIQFGIPEVSATGDRRTITIDGVTNYPGVFQNGTGGNANNDIVVMNIHVHSANESTLYANKGWVCQDYFGDGATENYIINCSSDGDITGGGGICGNNNANSSGSTMYIIGCSSTGDIGDYSSGIAPFSGNSGGQTFVESCWSSGPISTGGGGILGGLNATITNCYSVGPVVSNAGGICTQYSFNLTIQKCYSFGTLGSGAGGIVGADCSDISVTNSYTLQSAIVGNNPTNVTTNQCYAASGSWSSATASATLASLATTWVSTGTNTPFELLEMGVTPYSRTVVSADKSLVRTYSESVAAGTASSPAIVTGHTFSIISVSPSASFTINTDTGAITAPVDTVNGTYTIRVRSSINPYAYTTVTLTVTEGAATTDATGVACVCDLTPISNNIDYDFLYEFKAGNTLVVERAARPATTYTSYADYLRYKLATLSRP